MSVAKPPLPISFEFFPPNTPVGDEKLKDVVRQLGALQPEFFSVTYGAGGSTRDKTLAHRARHCRSRLRGRAAPVLRGLHAQPASPRSWTPTARRRSTAWWRCAATCPAARSPRASSATPPNWCSSCARRRAPTGTSRSPPIPNTTREQRYSQRDLQHYVNKVKCGADSSITQFFFNPDAYFHFVEATRRLGAAVPVVPGIMPFHNFAKIAQFAARDGIEIPRWVTLKMEGFMDDTASIRAFGLDVVTALCERLIAGGAPGIHFYTMNQSALTLELCQRLGLGAPAG